jgi:hypothetical protein
MNWDAFILGMCSGAIFFNLKDFFNSKINTDDGNIIFNIIIFVLILLISIERIIKI